MDEISELLSVLAPFIEIWEVGGPTYKKRMSDYWDYDTLHKARAAITKARAAILAAEGPQSQETPQ